MEVFYSLIDFIMCLFISVVAVTGFDLWGAVLAMGLVCTLYTALVGKIHPDYLKVSSL